MLTEHRYRLFGGTLQSSVELPELHGDQDSAAAMWTVQVRSAKAVPLFEGREVGLDHVAGGVTVALHVKPDGASRLTYSDTGVFDVASDGRRVVWYRPEMVDESLARTDLLGRVMALAAHRAGILTLHASGVAICGQVVGFLAPKHFGKSTLASVLTDAGARLVTDDVLALRTASTVECAPGVPALRLRHESALRLGRVDSIEPDDSGEWRHVDRRDIDAVARDWLPVAALYLLDPQPADSNGGPSREPVDVQTAAMSLIRHAKLGALLGRALAADYLERAVGIVSRTPVFRLRFPRDFSRLGAVAREIIAWHRG